MNAETNWLVCPTITSLTRDPADPANEVILNPDEATVSIQDDDGKLVIVFSGFAIT